MTEPNKNVIGDKSSPFCILHMITLPINIIPFQFYFNLKIKVYNGDIFLFNNIFYRMRSYTFVRFKRVGWSR